jgi:site-specific DNA-methyltransferase (adenine-specific)
MEAYFTKNNFTLYNGDCIDIMNNMREKSVDMIFADPPYFLSSGTFTCQAGKMVSVKKGDWDLSNGFDKNYLFHLEWIKACRRILKDNGTIWISGTYHSIYQCGSALQANKFHILNDISWFKPNAAPNLSCRFFTASHETLIWARKEKTGKHIFNYKEMKDGKWDEDTIKKPNTQMRSVWSINTPKPIEKKYGKHPTQKPLDLLRRIVLASTNKGNVILDPFTGSSTTGIAASMYDRQFIGIDIEKKYLDLSIKRLNDVEPTLLGKTVKYAINSADLDSSIQPYMLEKSKKYKKTKKNK